jgi:hypothetical protein
METRQYNVYKFSELSEDGKKKAIEKYYDINVDYDWWDFTYEDARTIGLEIGEFNLDRANNVKGHLTMPLPESIEAVLANHGDACETYKTASRYKKLMEQIPDDESQVSEEAAMELEEDYLKSLCEDYLKILRDEYDYLTSEEVIIETFESNEYDFTEDGEID